MEKISLLFWLNNSKVDSKGNCRIMLRITINKIRSSCASPFKTTRDNWDNKHQQIIGNDALADAFSAYSDITKVKVLKVHRDLLISGEQITPQIIIERLRGTVEVKVSILQAFDRHNEQMNLLIGKDIMKGTYNRYLVTLAKLKAFLNTQPGNNDILLEKLNSKFIADFELFLKTNDTIGQNTISKHLKILKKAVRFAVTNQWIKTDPFGTYRCRTTQTERGFLTRGELELLESKDIKCERLEIVRDIFIFACYTGLSYSDVHKLTANDIFKDDSGDEWIRTKRKKTGTESLLPILAKAKEILEKYQKHPICSVHKKLLPTRSNQKMNEYLTEIAVLCGINKWITFHLARHTFATTITLSNGVSTETVSKMLGHKSIRTTQIYAKMTLNRIASEMNQIKGKI